MDTKAWMTVLGYALALSALGFVLFVMIRSIKDERSPGKSIWKEFGLGLSLMLLFFTSWIAQAMVQWASYSQQQIHHGEEPSIGGYLTEFGQATLENWQSEFLQLFAFVTLAALYVFKGSAESKDSEEKIEAALRRIEENLGTLPDDAPKKKGDTWKLPDAPPLQRA